MMEANVIKVFNALFFTVQTQNRSPHVNSFFQCVKSRFWTVCFLIVSINDGRLLTFFLLNVTAKQ